MFHWWKMNAFEFFRLWRTLFETTSLFYLLREEWSGFSAMSEMFWAFGGIRRGDHAEADVAEGAL